MSDELDDTSVVGDEGTPTGRLAAAIQLFISETEEADTPVLLDTAIVVWERVRYDEDGRVMRRIAYSCPTPGGGMASYVGLLSMGADLLAADLLEDVEDE